MILQLPDTPSAAAAAELIARLREAGHEALLVGGCVRSLALGEPPKDYDVATSARPEQVQALFERTIPVGVAFGVVIVGLKGHMIEVATFRTDGRYLDSRRPETVTFSDARADAQRRDFTVNALFLDLLPLSQNGERGLGGEGNVIDHVSGLADLDAHLIRTVGDPKARFEEDALRLLRAVRFAARCAFTIEEETWCALRRLVPMIRHVSAERVGDELVKIFTGPNPGDGLRLLDQSRLLDAVLPEVAAMRGVEQPPEFHPEGDVLTHTCLCLDHLPPNPPPALALAVLLHDVGKPLTFERAPDRIRFNAHETIGAEMTRDIGRRLRLSNALIEATADLVRQHMRFKDAQQMRRATLKRFLLQDTFDLHLALHRCDDLGRHGDLALHDWCVAQREALRQEGESRLPPPLLTGNDLIAMGFTPGPLFREILEAVQTEQLEGRVTDQDQAKAVVLSGWGNCQKGAQGSSPKGEN